MWIRLKDNIPNIEDGTPPTHSIFWAVPWIDMQRVKDGCIKEQTKLVAIGVDVAERFVLSPIDDINLL